MARKRRRGLVERSVHDVLDRTGSASGLNKALRKVFPTHFSFMWGEIALYCFVVLIATGIYLTLFFHGSQETTVYSGSYEPLNGATVSAAYDSVVRISFDVKAGLVIRRMHHWAALVFIAAISLHMARIFFTGAFRKPREINWVIGVLLFVLALGAGFTGYSLPDDLLSAAGLRITSAIVLAIPFIGERLQFWMFGGDWPGDDIVGRLYPVHIMLIPGLIIAALAVHLFLVWHQKHTQFRGPGRTENNVVGERVWPAFAMKSIGLMFVIAGVLAAMGALIDVNPIWLYGPYAPGGATSYSQPDWYVGFLEGSLRLMPPWETRIGKYTINNLMYSGVLVPLLIFGFLFMVPWIERRFSHDTAEHNLLDRPRDAPIRTAVGAALISVVIILFLGGGQDIIANTLNMSVGRVTTFLQFGILIVPPIVFVFTRSVCRGLAARGEPDRTERDVGIARNASGGFDSEGTTFGADHDDDELLASVMATADASNGSSVTTDSGTDGGDKA